MKKLDFSKLESHHQSRDVLKQTMKHQAEMAESFEIPAIIFHEDGTVEIDGMKAQQPYRHRDHIDLLNEMMP